MNWSVRLTTATVLDSGPTGLISLNQARFALTKKQDGDAENASYISKMITGARKTIEKRLNRIILTSTWTLYMDVFSGGTIIEIPIFPVQAVDSVKYYNTDDPSVLTTMVEGTDSGEYETDLNLGRIRAISSFPATKASKLEVVEIQFQAGDVVADVPEDLRQAILQQLWEDYHGNDMSEVIENKIQHYRRHVFA